MFRRLSREITVSRALIAIAVFGIASGSSYATMQGSSSGREILGCYARAGGELRIVQNDSECRRGEIPIGWSARGSRGPRGPKGTRGVDGSIGARGAKGSPGPAGSRGVDGTPGSPGTDGQDGVPGLEGQSGPEGSAGPEGPSGEPGTDGQDGAEGPTGPEGPAGTGIASTKEILWYEEPFIEPVYETPVTVVETKLTVPSSGKVLLTGDVNISGSGSNSNIRLYSDGTQILLREGYVYGGLASFPVSALASVAAGEHTFKITYERTSSGGFVSIRGRGLTAVFLG
jgi:collagen triple helix repeat protein